MPDLGEREQLIKGERELRKAEENFSVLVEQAADGIERLNRGETIHSSWVFRRKDGSSFHGEVTAKQLLGDLVQELRPDIALALTSGYMSDALRSAAEQLDISQLVKKPETIDRLCAAIERAPDEADEADEADRLALQA